jgi:60 kDa SS-A/Ro ribonucleoprotein
VIECKLCCFRLVVVGLSQSAFSLADPSDPGMLDVAGFDGTALQVIQDFVNGRF